MKKVQQVGPKKITILYPLKITKEKSKKNKIKAAAYCRVSSNSEEQMESYNAQIKYYEKHIKENDSYSFAGIYADQGISGTSTKNRDAFNRMIKDAKAGKIDIIITKSISRFGRNTIDTLNTIRELKAKNIDVFFEKENIHTSDSRGELLITLLSAISQQESVVLGENVKWGKRRKFEKGDISSIPWKNLTGYDKNTKGEVIIIEKEAEIIRRIFNEFIKGYGTSEIARRLNDSMTDGKWTCTHIFNILKNEKYKGDVRFQLYVSVDPLAKKQMKNTGQLPQYYAENSHPAIVSKEIWELANLEMARQRRYCKDHKINIYHSNNELPLTGRIICKNCGNTFKMKASNKSSEKVRRYYSCKKYRSGYKSSVKIDNCCNGTRLFIEDAHQTFVKAWNYLVDHPEEVEAGDSDDVLKNYRAKDLKKLLERGKIESLDKDIIRRVLEKIDVDENGDLEVRFLAGCSVKTCQ